MSNKRGAISPAEPITTDRFLPTNSESDYINIFQVIKPDHLGS
jgi:hypothetical protein